MTFHYLVDERASKSVFGHCKQLCLLKLLQACFGLIINSRLVVLINLCLCLYSVLEHNSELGKLWPISRISLLAPSDVDLGVSASLL